MAILTKSQILSLFEKVLSARNSTADLSTGTVETDLGVEALAQVLEGLFDEIVATKGQISLDAQYYTDAAADQLALMYGGLVRNSAVSASGSVTFGALNAPTDVNNPIIIPIGTVVFGQKDTSSNNISYVTTTEGRITNTSVINPSTGYYEATVNIEAVTPGSDGNIGIGYINQLSGSINNIVAVYNKEALVNGADLESTESLLQRVALTFQGRNLNTKAGLKAWTLSHAKVNQCLVVDPNDEYSIRGPGAVDTYIKGTTTTAYTQTVTTKEREVILDKQPVYFTGNADQITVTIEGVIYGADSNIFTFVKDSETIYQNSVKGKDKIVFTDMGYTLVNNASYYTINYTYNSLIDALQQDIESENNALLTGDILFRSTNAVPVEMEFGIVVFNGYNKDSVIAAVKSNIELYVNNMELDYDLRQSDIVNIVENTEGVDYMTLPFLKFCRLDEIDPSKQAADVVVGPLDYITIKSDDIVIG